MISEITITIIAIEPDHFEESVLHNVPKIEVIFCNNTQSLFAICDWMKSKKIVSYIFSNFQEGCKKFILWFK